METLDNAMSFIDLHRNNLPPVYNERREYERPLPNISQYNGSNTNSSDGTLAFVQNNLNQSVMPVMNSVTNSLASLVTGSSNRNQLDSSATNFSNQGKTSLKSQFN